MAKDKQTKTILTMFEQIGPIKGVITTVVSFIFGMLMELFQQIGIMVSVTNEVLDLLQAIAFVITIIVGICTTINYFKKWGEKKVKSKNNNP